MSVKQPGVVAGRRAVREVLRAAASAPKHDSDCTCGDTGEPNLVLVACSGGADSLALAACAIAEGRKLGVRVGAVVVDHRMQNESAQVAAHAAQQCVQLGLEPVEVVEVDVAPQNGGPEASARDARYAVLEQTRARLGADVVLLGHTLDDQAETVLMGLARGSGARALAGMRPVRGTLRRPFLGLTRATTELICQELALTWWTDPTNIAPDDVAPADAATWPLRSRVRSTLMPALTRVFGPGASAALARSADQLRDDDDLLRDLAAGVLARARVPAPSRLELDIAVLAPEHRAVRHRALHLAAITAGAIPGALNRAHVLTVDALITGWRGQGPIDLPGGIQVRREYGRLVLHPTTP